MSEQKVVVIPDGKICDYIDGKFRNDTPEEYSLLNTNIDIKGKAYEEIVGANLRGDRGEFFTPRNVMKMTVEMINPKINERVGDTSCGTGGFVVTAMTHVIAQIEKSFVSELGVERQDWDADTIRAFQDKISEVAGTYFFGFDINPDLVKATKMNMVMNNDGSGNILQTNSLLPPHQWTDEFRTRLAEAIGVSKASIRNHKSIEFFDVIVTNPPFGSKIPIKDKCLLAGSSCMSSIQQTKSIFPLCIMVTEYLISLSSMRI